MLRRPLVLLTAVLALVVGAAPALADDPWTVPSPATITITGDGSGHGKGLSQYGAYGAARAPYNLTAQQILDFYYPDTHAGSAGGTIAVLVSGDRDADLVVDDRDGLVVRAVGSGKVFALKQAAQRWRIKQSGGRSLVAYRASGTSPWRTVRTITGDAELTAGGKPVTLRSPAGARAYRGALRSTHHDGRRVTVNVLPLEAYVRGVVPSEVPGLWPQQALRAQAVAARTYAAYERAHTANPDYDLCDTAACQAYGGATAEYPTSDAAVTATAHQVLTYQGGLAFAQFSASNGGYTVAGQFPYLPAQEDPYEAGASPDYYGWTETVTDAQVEQAYNYTDLTEIAIETRDGNGPRGGRVETVRLTSSTGFTTTVTGESFRRNLGLRSTLFEITDVQPG